MAGESIYALRHAKHPTVAVAGAVSATLSPGTVATVNQGAAGATGRAESLVHYRTLDALLQCIDIVYCLRSAVHNVTTIANAIYARVVPRTVFRVNQGAAAAKGPAEALVTYYELAAEVYSTDYAELLALIGAAKSTLTLGIEGAAGADQSIALSNFMFTEALPPIEVPANDAGGTLRASGIRGYVEFGAGEVFADVITATPTNWTAALAKVGAAAANLVLGTEGAAGADEKLTLKNAHFVEPVGALELPAFDAGGTLSPFGIRAICEWGAADTFATMLTAAADS